jgi:Biotin-lipoyl like
LATQDVTQKCEGAPNSQLVQEPPCRTLLTLLILYTIYEFLSGVLVYSRDAYITTDVIAVAPEVSGPLTTLAVKDNQVVQQGDLLLKINPEPFRLDLDRLQAGLELAQANTQKAKEEVATAFCLLTIRFGTDSFLTWSVMLVGAFSSSPFYTIVLRDGLMGTQGGVALIIALVSGFGPPDSILPAVNRIAGMLCGVGILLCVSFVFGHGGGSHSRAQRETKITG